MARLRFGPFEFDPQSGQLWKFGHRIRLQPKSAAILAAIVESPGTVVARERLRARLWPEGTFVDFDRSINVAVKRLRDVLNDSTDQPKFIATVPGEGYRFIAPVTTILPEAVPGPVAANQSTRRRFPRLWIGVAAVLAIATGVGSYFAFTRPAIAFHSRDWVLIADFDNRTGEKVLDGTLEYAVERELGNSQFAYVVPRERVQDALRLMKKPLDTKLDRATAREVCLRDGAIKAVVTGRVEKIGTNYVLSVEVVDPVRDVVVASLSEEDPADTLLARAVRRLSGRVRETLGESRRRIEADNQQLDKVTTPSLRALQLYTQASRVIAQGGNSDQIAAGLLEQSLREDPDFASAHVLLGYAYKNQLMNAQAAQHFRRAFELAGATSERERYFILASYYGNPPVNQLGKAAANYESLLRLYPDHSWAAKNLVYVYYAMHKTDMALALLLRIAALRPNDVDAQYGAAWAAYDRLSRIGIPSDGRLPNRQWTDADFAPARHYLDRAVALLEAENDVTGDVAYKPWELYAQIDWTEGRYADAHTNVITAETHAKTGAESLAATYAMFGNFPEAEKRVPFDPLYHPLLADFEGDQKRAYEYLKNIDFSAAANATVDSIGVLVLAHAGHYREAQAMYRRTLAALDSAADPQLSANDASFARGELALAAGNTREGISLLEEALPKMSRGGSQFREIGAYDLARTYRNLGRPADAIRVLEQASTLSVAITNFSAAWQERDQLLLAGLYRQVGRKQDASRLEHVLAQKLAFADPDNPLRRDLAALSNAPETAASHAPRSHS